MPGLYSWELATRSTARGAAAGSGSIGDMFPLSISANGRHLVDGRGQPFFINGDTIWSLEVQPTRAQIDTIVADRAARKCNAMIYEVMEHEFSSQTPAYRNAEGNDPFTISSPDGSISWVLASSYKDLLTYIYNKLITANILPVIFPAYLGAGGGSQGWNNAISNAGTSTTELFNFGVELATAYPKAMWSAGGDYAGTSGERSKQWNIFEGILSVLPNAIITGHTGRCTNGGGDGEAYNFWGSGFSGFNLNNIYSDQAATSGAAAYQLAASAQARSPAMPFFLIESYYEQRGGSNSGQRLDILQAIFSGACGYFHGQDPLWALGAPGTSGGGVGAANSVANDLDTEGAQEMTYLFDLMTAYQWWTLEPKTDSSLVSTSLGSGASRVCPMLASSGAFAMIYIRAAGSITVVMSNLTPSTVRARWWNAASGVFTAIDNYPNTGSQGFTSPGSDRVLVLDAAP